MPFSVKQYTSGVQVWISLAALVATVCALIAQLCRHHYLSHENAENAKRLKTKMLLLMAPPVVLGGVAVGYTILGGAAILNHSATLPGWWDALHSIWQF